jgi:hypothetical protein
MLQRIGRGWGMTKASRAVLKVHPKLLRLPILPGLEFVALFAPASP